ncbi:calcyphosin-2 isoform X3 [Rhineura floridana]|uniref:calcyphosin-2 isoform X3 n=1 Tax=Rhineura floridana TaxID=261503 RepID=UPI002AC87BE3|nr:calcyphosin-2 isoform X3 [Rhineura floridana]
MDLEVKGVAASPRKHVPLSSKKNKLAQGWRTHTKSNHGPRPAEVPCLDLGKLGDSEDEDGDTYIPYSAGEPHTDPLQSSSTISWGTPVQNPSAQHYDIQQLSLWEQKTVPENLPPPADSYKLKYQQYEAEMKEGYKEYSQRAEEKKAKNSQPHKTPGKIIEEQPKNKTDDELTVLDEKALLQQCYASKPYTTQHNIRKLEAEDLATERKKQAVVEQVMIDQLSRAVISDPEQNMRTDTCEKDLMFPGLRTAPLRFRKRTLHETKIRTRSALTENMLSNKLRFDGRLISRTKALPFIQKGIYSHQRGQRKGKQYCLNDVYIVLEQMDFGDNFIKWIRSIYTSQKARIIVNGDLTDSCEIQKGTRQGCPLSPLLFILVLEVLLRDIRQDKRISGLKIKKEEYKLRAFADDLIIVLENPLEGINVLMDKLKEFGPLAGFKINNQKTKMLVKKLTLREQKELMDKTDFTIEKKLKYLGIIMTNKNSKLFHNNYEKLWTEIKKDLLKWDKLQLSLMGRISVIKMNVLPRMMFLFQTIPVISSDLPFKQWQKDISKFVWQGKNQELNLNYYKTPKKEEDWDYQI